METFYHSHVPMQYLDQVVMLAIVIYFIFSITIFGLMLDLTPIYVPLEVARLAILLATDLILSHYSLLPGLTTLSLPPTTLTIPPSLPLSPSHLSIPPTLPPCTHTASVLPYPALVGLRVLVLLSLGLWTLKLGASHIPTKID